MGVYINDMKMPKGKQIIELRIYADGVVTMAHDRTCRKIAEATEVHEPHGRLIDADVLLEEIRTDIMGGLNYESFIKKTSTIIERSE